MSAQWSHSNKKYDLKEILLLIPKFICGACILLGIGLAFVAMRCTDWLTKRKGQPSRMHFFQ